MGNKTKETTGELVRKMELEELKELRETKKSLNEELLALKENASVKAIRSMADFIDTSEVVKEDEYTVYDDDGNAVKDVNGNVTTALSYNVLIGDKFVPVSTKALADELQNLVYIFRIGKASTTAIYCKLAMMAKDTDKIKETGFDNVVDLANALLGVKRDTVKQYVNSVDMFYNVTAESCTPKDDVYKNVSLTNLNQICGLCNEKAGGDAVKFAAMYVKSGKITISGTLSKVKADIRALNKDIDEQTQPTQPETGATQPDKGTAEQNTDNATTQPENGTAQPDNGTTTQPTMTPKAQVEYYSEMIADVFEGTDKAEEVARLLHEIELLVDALKK